MKITSILAGLFFTITLSAMQELPQKCVQEITEFIYTKNPRHVDSFFEEYNRGTITLNEDNSINFSDLHDNTIEYTVAHSKAIALIQEVINFRKAQIIQKNAKLIKSWLKNSINNDFSPEFTHIAIIFRFLKIQDDIDLLEFGPIEQTKVFMENRAKYREAFASANKAAFDEAQSKPINPSYESFERYIQAFQEMIRKSKSKSATPIG